MKIKLIGNDFGDAFGKWRDCTLGNDGCLYAIPLTSRRILKIDPTDDSTTLVGPDLGTGSKCLGCIAGPDGNIYGLPSAGRDILRFNPVTEEVTMVGDLATNQCSSYMSGAFAPNGILYLIPGSEGKIARYDPFNDSTSLIGDDLPTGHSWYGAVLAGDGCIYFIPFHATRVIKFDPTSNESISFIGDESIVGSCKWYRGVLGPDGNVYGISYCHNFHLKIDIRTQSTSLVGPNLGRNGFKYIGGAVGRDHCIYMMPYNAEFVMRYNPVTGVTSNVDESLGDQSAAKYASGVLAPNGYIYATPSDTKKVLRIKTWDNWAYLKPRLLVEQRRATRRIIQFDDELNVIQHFIIHTNDDIFRHVLEML